MKAKAGHPGASGPVSPEPVRTAASSPVWLRLGSVTVTRRRALTCLGVGAAITAAMLWGGVDLQAINAWAKRFPAWLVVALIVVLPLTGFPVSWLHVAAGVRFDFWPGLAVVLVTSVLQNTIAWSLVRVTPRRFFARLEPWRRRLGKAGHVDAVLFCGLMPGMPYVVQLYLLPILGVPWRILCLCGSTVVTARATATILLGNMSGDFAPEKIAWLVSYYVLLTVVCALVLRHLRRSLEAE